MTAEVELVLDARALTGEGRVWDPLEKILCWIDIMRCELHRFNTATRIDDVHDLGVQGGAVALRRDGGLVLAAPEGFDALDSKSGDRVLLARVEHDATKLRLDDGKCARGRFWAGNMGPNPADPTAVEVIQGSGKLYRLDTNHSVHTILDGVTVSTGMGWSPTDDTFTRSTRRSYPSTRSTSTSTPVASPTVARLSR